MSKKIVVFDLDDTLISEREYIDSGFRAVAEVISKQTKLSKDDIKNKMDELFKKNSLNVFNRTLNELGITYEMKYIKELISTYRSHIPTIKLYDDAKDILEYLYRNNYRVGMITDGYKETQRNKIKALGIEKYFEHIVITDELGREFWKPSEVPYNLIRYKFNCKYKDMVYIGDNINKDFISANKLGIETIQITRGNGIYCLDNKIDDIYNPKIKIKSLEEIKIIIR